MVDGVACLSVTLMAIEQERVPTSRVTSSELFSVALLPRRSLRDDCWHQSPLSLLSPPISTQICRRSVFANSVDRSPVAVVVGVSYVMVVMVWPRVWRLTGTPWEPCKLVSKRWLRLERPVERMPTTTYNNSKHVVWQQFYRRMFIRFTVQLSMPPQSTVP